MYRPLFRPQYPDPTTTQDWTNCTMASGAMLLDFHTQGNVQKWGGELRRLQSDQVGGTDIGDLKVAWYRLGFTLNDRRGRTWADVIVDLKSGRGVVLTGDYDVLLGRHSCQGTFNGNHAVYLNPNSFNTDGIVVGDPLCNAYKRIPISALKAYSEKLGRSVYGSTTPQKIMYATSRAWPDPIVQPTPTPVTTGEEDMIVGEGIVRTSSKFVAVKKGVSVYREPTCKTVLTTMSADAQVDFMGTVPGNTTAWAVEIATGKIVEGKLLPVIAYVKRSEVSAPEVRTAIPNFTKSQVDAAVAAAVAPLTARIAGIKGKSAAFNADIQND